MSTPPEHRDAAAWAHPVERLEVTEAARGKRGINVSGKRQTSPLQGFGRMWQKTYKTSLEGSTASPQQVIAEWKEHFPEFWPRGNSFFAPLAGINPGEVASLELGMPGGMKLSTGVLVLYADDESFTLMTPQGHMFAGWITFSSFVSDGVTWAQAQVLMRASDPLYEMGMTMGGRAQGGRPLGAHPHAAGRAHGRDAARLGAGGVRGSRAAVVEGGQRLAQRWDTVWHVHVHCPCPPHRAPVPQGCLSRSSMRSSSGPVPTAWRPPSSWPGRAGPCAWWSGPARWAAAPAPPR